MIERKNELTEELKLIEDEIHNKRIDVSTITSKLEIAQKYETELLERLVFARKKTDILRKDFFIESGKISAMYDKMKDIFDVWTGNFHKHFSDS